MGFEHGSTTIKRTSFTNENMTKKYWKVKIDNLILNKVKSSSKLFDTQFKESLKQFKNFYVPLSDSSDWICPRVKILKLSIKTCLNLSHGLSQ